jgi:2-desacetyl-2-hydroxyethyl bacteriochlorophyllide A dehydrogenase
VKAAVIAAKGVVEYGDVPEPRPGPREVLVKVAATGICGTDLHILDGEFAPTLPVIPGHEFAGEVVGLGSEVTELSVGTKVAVDPSLYCFECYYCKLGKNNLCENWNAIGVTRSGAAAELVVAPYGNCVALPSDVRVEDYALVEPLSCAVRGYDVLKSQLGAHVLIYGAGTMGLMMLQLAKAVGAVSVDMVDINADRLRVAEQLGCTSAVQSADEIDRPRLWDLVVDATGNDRAIQDGLGRVGKGGTFLQFGVSSYAARATIEPYKIYNQEITITGSMAVLHSYERAADLFATGVIDPDVFISHRLPLSEFEKGLQMMARGEGRKIQVQP